MPDCTARAGGIRRRDADREDAMRANGRRGEGDRAAVRLKRDERRRGEGRQRHEARKRRRRRRSGDRGEGGEREAAIVQSAKVTWRVVTYVVLCSYTRGRVYLRYTTA